MAKVARVLLTVGAFGLMALLGGCVGAHTEKSFVAAIRGGELQDSQQQTPSASPAQSVNWNPAEQGLRTVPVASRDGVPAFETVARTGAMEGYPCSQCHDQPLSVLNAHKKKDEALSHWQVKMLHASDSFMSCQTCHGEGEMDELILLSGTPVSFDASYQVCAQCHGKQEKDWVGGGHGKRLGGWAPPRVVETCTGCHNPHAPAFEMRWPAQLTKGMR